MSQADALRAAIRDFDEVIALERILLRRMEPADVDALHPLLADWDVVRWLARPAFPVAKARTAAFCTEAATRQAVDGELDLAIVGEAGPIGAITWRLAGPSPVQRETGSSIGFWLGRPYWGQGVMTAAARALIGRVFALTDVDAVYSGYFDGNLPSARVQAKLGFAVDGRAMIWCNPHQAERLHINTRLARANFATGQP